MIGAAKYILLFFIASTVIGCAIGQSSQYTGGIQFVPPKIGISPLIVVTVIDQRPDLLSGSISESNVGILRSLAGIPWAVHTSSGKALALDLGESIVQTLNSNGYKAVYANIPLAGDVNSSFDSTQADNSYLIFRFLLKEWKHETWFSQQFSFCVELRLIDIQDKTLAKTDQCGQKKLGSEDVDFESLSKAVGTVIGKLINTNEISAAIARSQSTYKVDKSTSPVKDTKFVFPQKTSRCTATQISEMRELAFSEKQIQDTCEP